MTMSLSKHLVALVVLLTWSTLAQAAPLRIGVVGLAHGHVAGFFGQALKRTDIQIVGIAEQDGSLFDRYAQHYKIDPKLRFPSLDAMLSEATARSGRAVHKHV